MCKDTIKSKYDKEENAVHKALQTNVSFETIEKMVI